MAEQPIGSSILVKLLEEDHIRIPQNNNVEKMVFCFSPYHDNTKTPSMSINTMEGVYYCHSCGIKGNAYSYLTAIRGYAEKRAVETLKGHGWGEAGIKEMAAKLAEREQKKKGRPLLVNEPYEVLIKNGKPIARQEAIHDYKTADGAIVCRVIRYEALGQEKAPKIKPYTPKKEGGWWMCWPNNDALPAEDQKTEGIPLYGLHSVLLQSQMEKQVWIVEGERCVDRVLGTTYGEQQYQIPCVSPMKYLKTSELKTVDWEPLRNRKVLIIADTDDVGRKWAKAVAQYLHDHVTTKIRTVMPTGDGGYDIGDAIAEGGPQGALKWIKEIGVNDFIPEVIPVANESTHEDDMLFLKTDYFTILGLSGNNVVIQKTNTFEDRHIPRNALSGQGNLVDIAPLEWWQSLCGESGFSDRQRLQFANAMIRAAEHRGLISMDEILGRGAAIKEGQYFFNTGSGILCENQDGLLTERRQFTDVKHIFTPGPTLKIDDTFDRAEEYALDLYNALMCYRWNSPNDGNIIAGWIVSSLVGGALRFRPMIWLTAPHETGKTFIMQNGLQPVHGNAILRIVDATAASISNQIKSDSLPIHIDEFEPEGQAKNKHTDIMALIRMATSGEAARVRANVSGGIASKSIPRFSAVITSVNQMELTMASESRFAQVSLSQTPVKEWATVREKIFEATKAEKMNQVRSWIIAHTKHIVTAAHAIEDAMIQEGHSTREAQIYSAITAGVRHLSGNKYIDIETETRSKKDDHAPLITILGSKIKVGQDEYTIAECLEFAYKYEETGEEPFKGDAAQKAMGRHGLRIAQHQGQLELRVCYGNHMLKKLLVGSAWEGMNIDKYLQDLPYVQKRRNPNGQVCKIRSGGILMPYIPLPASVLQDIGVIPDLKQEEEDILSGDHQPQQQQEELL